MDGADAGPRHPAERDLPAQEPTQRRGTPTDATGTNPAFSFTVTTPSNPAWVQYRATSKAGAAVGTHDVLTQAGPFYKVTGLSYTDHLIARDFHTPPCNFGVTQNNAATFAPSGQALDGGLSPAPDGSMTGFLQGGGTLEKSAVFAGCLDDGTQTFPPCMLSGTETALFDVLVEIVLPPGDAPARLAWHRRPLTVGDVIVTNPGQCVAFAANGPQPRTRLRPRRRGSSSSSPGPIPSRSTLPPPSRRSAPPPRSTPPPATR